MQKISEKSPLDFDDDSNLKRKQSHLRHRTMVVPLVFDLSRHNKEVQQENLPDAIKKT